MIAGFGPSEIALESHVSIRTVNKHIRKHLLEALCA
jgi:DNA-binding NarL/FixJ family response regulator